jgi:hypothetical protein
MEDTFPPEVAEADWVEFPGGELEGRRPKVLCAACREKLKWSDASVRRQRPRRPLCFECYRAGLERERALRAAGDLQTASEERFQSALPFEPVNAARLERLRAERASARAASLAGVGRFVDRRRRAQIAARRALQGIAAGLRARDARGVPVAPDRERARILAAAAHAAELQLPEAWLPFVVSR